MDGEPYYDKGWTGTDGKRYHDHITEDAILKAALDYVASGRTLGEMHKSAAVDALESSLESIPDPAVRKAAQAIIEKGQSGPQTNPLLDTFQKVKKVGEVPFVFPLVSSILEPLGITTRKTGLLIGAKPTPDIFAKFVTGELTGFSVGGKRGEDRIVEE